jgi:hypothetical protein
MIPAEELKTQLAALCDDLWWSSEADYPVEVFWQSPAASKSNHPSQIEALINQLVGEDTEIQTGDIDAFFAKAIAPQSWHEDSARLQQLKTLLTTALEKPQAYRCGAVEVSAYLLGYASDGSIAGVKTTLVET